MNTKSKRCEKESLIATDGISSNLKSFQKLKNFRLTTSKPKKYYIITLRPVLEGTYPAEQIERKHMFDEKSTANSEILENVDESSEKSTSSLDSNNYELELKRSLTDLLRLNAGFDLIKKENKKKEKITHKLNLNDTKENDKIKNKDQIEAQASLADEDEKIAYKQKKKPYDTNFSNTIEGSASTALDYKIEISDFNNGPTASTTNNPTKNITKNETMTSSFLDNLLQHSVPILAKQNLISNSCTNKCKNLDSLCRDAATCNTHDTNPIDSTLLSSDKEICKRLEHLEKQVHQIDLEIKYLHKEQLPADDLAKFSLLSKHFYEVEELLQDLKVNCLKFQNIKAPVSERRKINVNGAEKLAKENLQSTMNFNFKDHEDSSRVNPHICWKRCNCDLYKRTPPDINESKTCCHDFLQNRSDKCLQGKTKDNLAFPTSKLLEPSACNVKNNGKNFDFTCNCIKYLPTSSQQNFINSSKDNENYSSNSYNSPAARFCQGKEEKNLKTKLPANGYNFPFTEQTKRSLTENIELNKNSQNVRSFHKENCNNGNAYQEFRITKKQNCPADSHSTELPSTTNNISKAISEILGNRKLDNVALTVFLESNNLYHIYVSAMQNGKCFGCFYTNEADFNQAKNNKLFDKFLLFFVLNSDNTLEERNTVLDHTFEFINMKQ